MDGRIQSQMIGGVASVVIDNPDRRNCVNVPMLNDLAAALEAAVTDGARVVLLRGRGEHAFCAGYDLGALPADGARTGEMDGPLALQRACAAMIASPIPVIAALRGACFGAGGELAVSASLRLAADDLKFSMPPAKLGIIYGEDGLRRFVQTIGAARTRSLFLTADVIDAARALSIGLVDWVVPAAEFDTAASALAARIAENAPLAVQGMHAIIERAADPRRFDDVERQDFMRRRLAAFVSEDYREGIAAMREKRKPVFRGR